MNRYKTNGEERLYLLLKTKDLELPQSQAVLDTTVCDKVCQWLATGRWFSPGTLVSSFNKTYRHDIAEILLKVALKHQKSFKSINQVVLETILDLFYIGYCTCLFLFIGKFKVKNLNWNFIWNYVAIFINYHYLLAKKCWKCIWLS
jgi:hypothetical protein